MNRVNASSSPLGPALIGLAGTRIQAHEYEWLQRPDVGGVVLFTRNYESRAQLIELVAELRELRSPRLIIAVDQEGGRVQRFRAEFTRLPPLGSLSALYAEDPDRAVDFAYRHARVMATEILAVGIDLSFAPVLDLNRGSSVIGDRSFGETQEKVTRLGRAYLAGMHDAGMKATGKHFPGHGSVVADSHVDDVTDDRSLGDIEAEDMAPFTTLADSLDALMIAHVVYPQVDELPAGYSQRWLQDILRHKLEYSGILISDDLGMHAAKSIGGVRERLNACLTAGCDLGLVCMPEDVREYFSGQAVELPDATATIERLYGRATVPADQLAQVASEGIREWAHWQKSLEALVG